MYQFNRINIYPIILFLLTSSIPVYSQFYESGTDPASIRWKQIHTKHYRIIFPADAEESGKQTADVLEYIYQAEGKSLDHYPKKIPVVLHNQSIVSNGFVVWAPKRAEWFLTPPPDNYAQSWINQLAIHESRHVVQVDKLNQGFTKALGVAIGQQAVGVVSGLVPQWFLEGDAVATETALSNSGRGRDPAFEMPLRTIALNGDYQFYDKAAFGSYRDYVPNHYELGYQLVARSRERYGSDVFNLPLDYVANEPYFFFVYPFNIGLRKRTGLVTKELYYATINDLTSRWTEQQSAMPYEINTPVNQIPKIHTNYRSPQYLNDSLFLAQKTGMAQTIQWVSVSKNGKEQVVFNPGIVNTERFSYSNGKLVWSESVSDIRWTNRSYSVVKVLDLHSGKEHMLQRKSRLFSPSLSPDGKTIAAIEISTHNVFALVLLDAVTGHEVTRITSMDEIQMPSWCADGSHVLLIVNNKDGKSIKKVDLITGWFKPVLAPTFQNIGYPSDAGEYAFFSAHYNGISNIYAVNYQSGEVKQVTSAQFGAFDPQPNMYNNRLLYTEYSATGYNIVEKSMDATQWIPIEALTDHSVKLYETLAAQENFNVQDSVIPKTTHEAKPFRKWTNLFNLHSWAPLYYEVNTSDVSSTKFYPGLVLFSQDLLGNLISSAGYSWRGYNAFHANLTYKGLYPMFDFTFDYGGQQQVLGSSTNENYQINPQNQSTSFAVRSYVPFVFTRNRYITGLVPQVKLSYSNSYLYSNVSDNYQRGLWETGYSINVYRYLRPSQRDLFPRWGAVLQAAFQHTPVNTEQLGYIYYAYGRMYFPGALKHHSLQVSGAWQQQHAKYLLFATLLNFPRGYANGRTEKMSMATVEYAFPFAYPDWSWGIFVYLKRARANVFCDIAENRYRVYDRNIQALRWNTNQMLSVGLDLLADANFFQIHFPVSIGLRTVYVPETNKVQPSLLLHVNFN